MKIGCVKEIKNNEFRAGLTSDNVKAYIAAVHHVYIEKGAGRVKSVAYETLQETDRLLPLLAPMSQIAGRLSIQEGAKYLEKKFGGAGILLAGVPRYSKGKRSYPRRRNSRYERRKIAVGMGANVIISRFTMCAAVKRSA